MFTLSGMESLFLLLVLMVRTVSSHSTRIFPTMLSARFHQIHAEVGIKFFLTIFIGYPATSMGYYGPSMNGSRSRNGTRKGNRINNSQAFDGNPGTGQYALVNGGVSGKRNGNKASARNVKKKERKNGAHNNSGNHSSSHNLANNAKMFPPLPGNANDEPKSGCDLSPKSSRSETPGIDGKASTASTATGSANSAENSSRSSSETSDGIAAKDPNKAKDRQDDERADAPASASSTMEPKLKWAMIAKGKRMRKQANSSGSSSDSGPGAAVTPVSKAPQRNQLHKNEKRKDVKVQQNITQGEPSKPILSKKSESAEAKSATTKNARSTLKGDSKQGIALPEAKKVTKPGSKAIKTVSTASSQENLKSSPVKPETSSETDATSENDDNRDEAHVDDDSEWQQVKARRKRNNPHSLPKSNNTNSSRNAMCVKQPSALTKSISAPTKTGKHQMNAVNHDVDVSKSATSSEGKIVTELKSTASPTLALPSLLSSSRSPVSSQQQRNNKSKINRNHTGAKKKLTNSANVANTTKNSHNGKSKARRSGNTAKSVGFTSSSSGNHHRRHHQRNGKRRGTTGNGKSMWTDTYDQPWWQFVEAFLESKMGLATSLVLLIAVAGLVAIRVNSKIYADTISGSGNGDTGYAGKVATAHASSASLFSSSGVSMNSGGSVGAGDISRMLQGQVGELQTEHQELQASYLAHRQENTYLREWFQRMHAEALQFVPSYKQAFTARNQQLLRDANGSDGEKNMLQTMGQAYTVVIPQGVPPESEFEVQVQDSVYVVTCPPSGKPGEIMAFDVPEADFFSEANNTSGSHHTPDSAAVGVLTSGGTISKKFPGPTSQQNSSTSDTTNDNIQIGEQTSIDS
mmetsp:Transcript_27955/g.38814  ORF Transcript_27955/g.38814 Transcript_27955/m.38814 type:complete len:860 (-) Transcript_27955:441-3020(-)